MVSDTLGGVWNYSLELSAALGKHGVRICLATMGGALNSAQRVAVASLRNVEVRPSGFLLEWMEEPWEAVKQAGEWLLGVAREFAPELVHLNGYSHAALGWGVPTLVVAHSCVLSWWEAVKGEAAPALYDPYRQRVKEGLRAAGLVVAPTRAMLEALQRCHGPLPQTAVVPNGIEGSRFVVGPKKCRVLAAGRVWDEAKGFALLDTAAEEVKWPVLLAGPRSERQRFPNLHLLGALNRKELLSHYRDAALFVAPSFYEPFGLAAVEAGLSGCALLLSDLASFREIWGDAAHYFQSGNAASLRSELLQLVEQRKMREEFSVRARERALQLSAARMGDAYLQLYARLVNSGVGV